MAIGDKKVVVMQSDIVNDFTTGGATNVLSAEMGKSLAQRPNPNLLDNWYLADPVDQRQGYVVKPGTPYYRERWTQSGTTSSYIKAKSIDWNANFGVIEIDGVDYFITEVNTTCVRGYIGTKYTIDRWMRYGGTTLLNDGYITLFGKFYNLDQIAREDVYKYLRGKTVTLSVFGRGHISIVSEDYANHYLAAIIQSAEFTVKSLTFTVRSDADRFVYHIQPQDENPCDIIAVKLELGSQQTLAHQDTNGNWVLNDIPDYNEELVKCRLSTADSSDTYANKSLNEAVDAAPAGFGLGAQRGKLLTSNDDLNNILENGWYYWEGSIPQNSPDAIRKSDGTVVPIMYAAMRVDSMGNTSLMQTVIANDSQCIPEIKRTRAYGSVDYGFREWGLENPPMVPSFEYRTTERYFSKPVYAKLVDFGELPNNTTKQISISEDSNVIPIWFEGKIDSHNQLMRDGYMPASFGTSGNYDITTISIDGSQPSICVKTNKNLSDYTAKILVKYYKTTD